MLPSGTVTFLFTDIQGSTQLWDSFPDEMRAALGIHDLIVTRQVERRGGAIVKHTGDGLFAAFGSCSEAAEAAVAIQRDLADQDWHPAIGSLEVRIALHTDDVEPEGDDYHHPAINRVARIEAAGHGGQILLSSATAALVGGSLPEGSSLVPLGTHLLRGLSTPEAIHQLTVDGLPSGFPPLRTVTTTTAKLPEFATSFIGRTSEITDLTGRAADPSCRLLTLVGPGGTGKTRLAVEVARRSASELGAVAHFLSLVPISSIDAVVSALADSLDFTIDLHALSSTFTEKRQVFDRLTMYPAVLVLDNFEHLAAHAGFVQELIDEVPTATVIVTSRERLGLQSEWVYPVPGLTAQAGDASSLFAERARQAGAVVDPADPAVEAICDLVAGMPLAIELAAAWAPMLSPAEIAAEVSGTLDFLQSTAGDRPERHRSLRAVFDYSWGLLGDDARQALAALGVFPSAFDREAAAAIAGVPLPVLFGLLQKSLVQRSGIDRFDLHPLVREFARERLGDGLADLQRAHAAHYARFLADRAHELAGDGNQIGARDDVVDEVDHVAVAMEWHMTHSGPEACIPLLEALTTFFFLHSWTEGGGVMARLAEARAAAVSPADALDDPVYLYARLSDLLLAQSTHDPSYMVDEATRLLPRAETAGGRIEAWALVTLGIGNCIAGELDEARQWFDRVESLEVDHDPLFDVELYAWAGWTRMLRGEVDEGHRRFVEGEALARDAGFELGRAYLLSKLGVSSDALGDHRAAADYHGQAQDVFVKFGDVGGQAYALSRLAWTWFLEGDHEAALKHALEGLEKFESVNHRWGTIVSRCRAALPEIELGRIDSATARLYEALDMAERAGMREAMMYALTGIGRAWAAQGDDVDAAAMLSFADSPSNPYQEFAVPVLEDVARRLGAEDMEAARARAADLDLDGAVRLARGH